MKLQEVRAALIVQRRRLDRAVQLIDDVLAQQVRGGGRDGPAQLQQVSSRLRRRLLRVLHEAGRSLEELREVSGWSRREVSNAVAPAAKRPAVDGVVVPRAMPRPTQLADDSSFQRWLDERTNRTGQCLIWTRALPPQQVVPMASRDGRSGMVRRLVWEHHHGAVAQGSYVTATRDCPDPVRCVAVEHSQLLSPHDASLERAAAGRVAHGEDHGHARLSEDQVLVIYHSNEATRDLATRFGVSPSTVYAIKTKRRWRHLHQGD